MSCRQHGSLFHSRRHPETLSYLPRCAFRKDVPPSFPWQDFSKVPTGSIKNEGCLVINRSTRTNNRLVTCHRQIAWKPTVVHRIGPMVSTLTVRLAGYVIWKSPT